MTPNSFPRTDSLDSQFSVESRHDKQEGKGRSTLQKMFPYFQAPRFYRRERKGQKNSRKFNGSPPHKNTKLYTDQLSASDITKILVLIPFPFSPILMFTIWYALNYAHDQPEWVADFLKQIRFFNWKDVSQDDTIWFENFGKSCLEATCTALVKSFLSKKQSGISHVSNELKTCTRNNETD